MKRNKKQKNSITTRSAERTRSPLKTLVIASAVSVAALGSGSAFGLAYINANRTDTPKSTVANVDINKQVASEIEQAPNQPVENTSPRTQSQNVQTNAALDDVKYNFLSAPDFLNADVGDVSKSPLYKQGMPNSTNESYEKSLDFVMDSFKNEGIGDMYVAGDLVEGHWGEDDFKSGVFGPVTTYKQRVEAAKRAGNLYYSQWKDRFKANNLNVYAAIGDHEIGDNPWKRDAGPLGTYNQARFDYWNFGARKQTFGENLLKENGVHRFTSRPKGQASMSAYAFRPHPQVQMVMVDVFRKTDTSVAIELDADQMKWLDGVLTTANKDGVKWIIVQGHTPVLTPVRKSGTLGLEYQNGANSAFWQLLKQQKVDLYLNGEVHSITAHQQQDKEPVQISHGGMFVYGPGTNYMVAKIDGDTITMDIKRFKMSNIKRSETEYMWQTDSDKTQPKEVHYDSAPYSVGTMSLTSDGTINERTGMLDVYKGVR